MQDELPTDLLDVEAIAGMSLPNSVSNISLCNEGPRLICIPSSLALRP